MLSLSGRGALVAGTRRIGAIVARRLAAEGVNLAIMYHLSRTAAEELAREVEQTGVRAHLIQADIAVEREVRAAVDEATEALGDLSFLVNLVSDFPRVPFEQLDSPAWDQEMAWAKGGYLIALSAARRMIANAGPTRGHIVLFSDWAAGETPYRNYLPYLTAKAATDFLCRALAVELAPHGILVNAIAPGPTARPPYVSMEEWEHEVLARAPLHRESSAEEIAELVAFLLKCETVTGETVRVDSGRHLAGPGTEMMPGVEITEETSDGISPGDESH